jgi:hypothetical protein
MEPDRPAPDPTAFLSSLTGFQPGAAIALPTEGAEPLTPEARRRPDAIAGPKLTLLDGREWELPEVQIEFAESDSRADGISYVTNISPEFDAALMAYEDATEGTDLTRHSLKLAGELLRRNYRLTVAETGKLVRWRLNKTGDRDSLNREFLSIALGIDRPKPGGDGSPSASELPE